MLPRGLKAPLGELRPQYRPRPLRVPAGYLRTSPPAPVPSISMVVPSLNSAAHIEAALDSVLSQGYPRLELIVMDGGSDDGSVRILEGMAGRLDHLESGPDRGQAAAINAGFGKATGEIRSWLNADDLLLPGSLAAVAGHFARHPEVDVVYGHRILIDEDGRDVGLWVTPPHGDDALVWFDFIPQETVFWRRELWERVGGLDESFDLALDWDLLVRFREAGATIARLPRFLGCMRLHPGQKTASRPGEAVTELAEIRDRVHGRHVGLEEAKARVDVYRARSVPRYAWERARRAVLRRREAAVRHH